jgi:hypothetical protein
MDMIFRIAALGIGAIAMYYLDPISGRRRRALVRDQVKGTARQLRSRARDVVGRNRRQLDIDLTQDLGR